MNKNDYNNAMDKIKVTDELKDKVMKSITLGVAKKNRIDINKAIVIFAMLVLIISAVYFTTLPKDQLNNNIASEFKITGEIDSSTEACYVSVLYLDGYSYEGSSWISYSIDESLENVDEIKGKKIGEVTLDLKGKLYEGTPPDFSSTYGVGTEVYEVKGIKKENAVLIVSGEMNRMIYRTRKALATVNQPIGLTVKKVINMMSDYPIIRAVELRDEVNGSWMRTSYDNQFLNLLNAEIQDLNILSYEEMKRAKDGSSYRIPVNFMFEDGALLHAQIYPEINIAYIFGGYINISNDLASMFEELFRLGNEYPRLTDIINYDPSNLGYFQLDNNITGDSIISLEPQWSGGALYDILRFYSVDKSSSLEGNLVATIRMGELEINSKEFKIYEGADGNLFFEVDGEFYKIVKGRLIYKDILEYQQNYTIN